MRNANAVCSRQSIALLKQRLQSTVVLAWTFTPLYHCWGWPPYRRATHIAVSSFAPWSTVLQDARNLPYPTVLLSYTQLISSARARNTSLHGNVITAADVSKQQHIRCGGVLLNRRTRVFVYIQ